ncbi:hypothetical protein [Methanococcus maripaludis]|uniref:Uncharacterized protein n=1 Tax=Methanococcus maripaludis TaxID=39152 RepID=A0A8T4H9Z8_METMI|nr:hypothetical protein [Methanococcus maripaludis]MBM7408398.1 hypothetical protein [Methanococcus maripaludis]MBP2220068.1 hypothetical protein [Methanococcus maripaludis]
MEILNLVYFFISIPIGYSLGHSFIKKIKAFSKNKKIPAEERLYDTLINSFETEMNKIKAYLVFELFIIFIVTLWIFSGLFEVIGVGGYWFISEFVNAIFSNNLSIITTEKVGIFIVLFLILALSSISSLVLFRAFNRLWIEIFLKIFYYATLLTIWGRGIYWIFTLLNPPLGYIAVGIFCVLLAYALLGYILIIILTYKVNYMKYLIITGGTAISLLVECLSTMSIVSFIYLLIYIALNSSTLNPTSPDLNPILTTMTVLAIFWGLSSRHKNYTDSKKLEFKKCGSPIESLNNNYGPLLDIQLISKIFKEFILELKSKKIIDYNIENLEPWEKLKNEDSFHKLLNENNPSLLAYLRIYWYDINYLLFDVSNRDYGGPYKKPAPKNEKLIKLFLKLKLVKDINLSVKHYDSRLLKNNELASEIHEKGLFLSRNILGLLICMDLRNLIGYEIYFVKLKKEFDEILKKDSNKPQND